VNVRTSYIVVIIAVGVLGGVACKSQQPSDEQKKIDELQAQLDDAKQQLAAKQEEPQPPAAETAEVAEQGAPAPAQGAQGVAPRAGATRDGRSPGRAAADKPRAADDLHARDQAGDLTQQRRGPGESQPQTSDRVQPQIESREPIEYTIPAGTVIPVRTTSELSTSRLATGAPFDAVLERALVVNGTVLAAQGAHVAGVVVSSDPGGRVKGVASLDVTIRSIAGRQDRTIRLKADRYSAVAAKSVGRDAKRTGIMTGAGAVVGAIAGGKKGAAIGAGAGAATGVGATMATRGNAAVIPAETLMEFRLAAPSTVVVER
jgi:hypothetical protein